MSKDSDSPGTEFKIAAAGPAVTLVLAALCIGVGILVAGGQDFRDAMLVDSNAGTSGLLAMVAWLASINILVLVFNLIPAFPLDGGRIARAIAWRLTGDRNRATRFAANLGRGFSYLLIGFGLVLIVQGGDLVITGVWMGLIGFILGQSARGYAMQSEFSSRIGGISVADVMDADPVSISEDTSVERAIDEYFLRYRWPWFPSSTPATTSAACSSARSPTGSRSSAAHPRPWARCSSPTPRERCESATTRRSSRCSATTRCGASVGWPPSTPRAACAA